MVVEPHAGGTVLNVRVVPRSSKSLIDGVADGSLRVRLAAPPVDGAANAALIELLARYFGIPKSRISILSGQRAKQKRLLLRGVDPSQVRERLELDVSR
jgi:uncharacterized protein (TIGR00251 family)